MTDSRVAVALQREYDADGIAKAIAAQFAALGIGASFFESKKVAIKPNLVVKKSPDRAATVHPAVLEGLLKVLSALGVSPVIAESPGGVYSRARLEGIYRVCGIADVAEKYGATLNFDTGARRIEADGKLVKSFNVIAPVADADVVIDLCKLKAHSLTTMSAAVKNFFGVIPGIEKFEMHAAYPDYDDFNRMLCDLCEAICKKKKVIAITDAVVGMEGNGPTAGSPREIGYLLASLDPFVSDLLCERILGFEGKVPSVREAISRGLCPGSADGIEVLGALPVPVEEFAFPDTKKEGAAGLLTFFSQGAVGKLFMPRPKITSDCRGCGECVRSCPQKTISLVDGRAEINYGKCIKCFCCQELCPFEAIKIKRNPITRLIGKMGRS